MRPTSKAIVLSLALLGAFAAGSLLSGPGTEAEHTNRRVLYWHDPMHPEYKSDKPGIAPDCGMQLEPVYADSGPDRAEARPDLPPGAVRIPVDKQQVIGIQATPAERSGGAEVVRTVGRVSVDERRIFRINAATPGWIVEAFPNSVGSLVKKDEALATFYAREFLGAQQALFYALDARDRFRAQNANDAQMASTNTQLQSATDTLRALGMSATQIEELSRVREKVTTIAIRAPAAGFILSRNVSPGQRFDTGTELFVIADLRRVWVLADMFQYEASFIRPGQTVQVSLPKQDREFEGRVSEVLPRFDATTRTLKVRIELDNPGYALQPDMFVDVLFPVKLAAALTVPSDAVLDTGLRQTVFVDLGDGYFEPRLVETGWRFNGRVQVLRGLMPGDRVVTSGAFLIDSEARMKAAAIGIRGEPARDPICAMDVDQARARTANRVVQHEGGTYFFCSDSCKKKFQAEPAKYTRTR